MNCYQLTLFQTHGGGFFFHVRPPPWGLANPLPPCLAGQPQHRLRHRLSSGPDHREHTDHRLLLWVPGQQRPLQELLHPLCRGLRDILGRLEAGNPRGSGYECLWVMHSVRVGIVLNKYCRFCFSFITRKENVKRVSEMLNKHNIQKHSELYTAADPFILWLMTWIHWIKKVNSDSSELFIGCGLYTGVVPDGTYEVCSRTTGQPSAGKSL